MDEKERTDKIYNPQYKIKKTYQRPMSAQYDKSDWNFRKFKTYEEFTKKFDNITTLEKK